MQSSAFALSLSTPFIGKSPYPNPLVRFNQGSLYSLQNSLDFTSIHGRSGSLCSRWLSLSSSSRFSCWMWIPPLVSGCGAKDFFRVEATSAPESAGESAKSNSLIQALQLGSLIGLCYLFNIYLSIHSNQMPILLVLSSLVPIVGGVALASFAEGSFNWTGFWCTMASNLTNQSRNVLGNKVLVKEEVETLLDSVKWDDKGLAVAIAQNVDTGAILMQGFINRDALAATISSGKATFYSRSWSTLCTKGETSKNFINVHDIFLDCDRDSIIYLGKPDGPTCHTGSETCYYTSIHDLVKGSQGGGNRLSLTTLYSLESTISLRKGEIGAPENEKPSWTKWLLCDKKLLCSKIREEADELCRTMEENEDESRTASEMADVLYHAMVLIAVKDVRAEEVLQLLRHRFSQSGIEEKRSRKSDG